jgi:hypothetical protein
MISEKGRWFVRVGGWRQRVKGKNSKVKAQIWKRLHRDIAQDLIVGYKNMG